MTLVGETCALMAALTWAFALVFFKHSGESITPLPLNLFKNVVGLVLLAVTLLGEWIFVGAERVLPDVSMTQVAILAASGILGIALADTFFFAGLNRIGVGLTAIVECTYTPFALLFSFLLLGEELTKVQSFGTACIILGVLRSSGRARVPEGAPRSRIAVGMLFGVAAMGTMTFGIVWAKPVLELEQTPLMWATAVRLLAGTVFLALLGLLLPDRGKLGAVFRPARNWRVSIPGSVLGTYVALVFWIAGFKYANAAIAAVLNQTSVIFAILFARLFLAERLTGRQIAAVGLTLFGVIVVGLGRNA